MRRLLILASAAVALTGCARLEEAGGELKGIADNVRAGGAPVYTGPAEAATAPAAPAPAAPAPVQTAARPAPAAPAPSKAATTTAAKAPRPAPAPKAPRVATAKPKKSKGRDAASYSADDKTNYLHMTIEGLSKTVRDGSLPDGTYVEITAPVDGRFNRQIVIDLRLGQGQAVSRKAGDCIQVLLPYFIDQNKFDSGRYVVRGIYRKADRDPYFIYEKNTYEPACGTAYLEARWVDKAP